MRFFHGGPGAEEKFGVLKPTNQKSVEGVMVIQRPPVYCKLDGGGNYMTEWVPCPDGSITVGFPGVGFFVVPPGGYADIPNEVGVDKVKAAAPHLFTEEEAQAAGLASPPAEPIALPVMASYSKPKTDEPPKRVLK